MRLEFKTVELWVSGVGLQNKEEESFSVSEKISLSAA